MLSLTLGISSGFPSVPVFGASEFSIRIRVLLLRVRGIGNVLSYIDDMVIVLNYVSDMCERYK